ncbi:uncharacterized protein LOC111518488 [Drosophila willistoni]|uniref:uncharacterized protein LOC111518488 n=1 Tax=Drosophila willistoni TaxID=7260 RepID=UPI000C26DA7B|nr:uncharacterized protein LOC111518488 [Drosophila willistoni]
MPGPNPKPYLLYKWQKQLGESCYTPKNGYMHCSLCCTLVTANRRSQLVNHLRSRRHQNALAESISFDLPLSLIEPEGGSPQQSPLLPMTPLCALNEDSFGDSISVGEFEYDHFLGPNDQFNKELGEALRGADIPFTVLDNENFTNFLAKYTNYMIPNQTFMQAKYKT